MRWRDAMVVGSGLVVIAAACSSFSDGDGPVTTSDAGADAPSSTAPDAAAPTIDAGKFCDGYPDAGFCFSFDDGTDPRIGGRLSLVEPSDASVTTASVVSAPNALAVEVASPRPDISGNPRTGVVLDIADAGTHLHCDLQLWAEQVSTTIDASTASLDVLLIATAGAGPLAAFDYSLTVPDPGGVTYLPRVGSGLKHETIGVNFSPGTWTPIGIDITLANSVISVRGSAQGPDLSPAYMFSTTAATTTLGETQIGMGEAYVVGDWIVRIDDVVCNWD